MGSIERIQNVAKRVAKWMRAGHQVVVVPSAMSGETNRLLGLAKELSANPNPRELDQIAATGEQVSSGLLAIALQEQGIDAVSYSGWQVTVHTDSAYTKARILGSAQRNEYRKTTGKSKWRAQEEMFKLFKTNTVK